MATGTVSMDEYSGGARMSVEELHDIDQAREIHARRLELDLRGDRPQADFSRALAEVLRPFREGRCPVWINYRNDQARAALALGRDWCVHPSDELLHRLQELAGAEGVRVVYE